MNALDDNISSVMATRIEMVSDTVPIAFAAKLMVDKHITGLPVTTEEGELIGVLSWSDVARALSSDPPRGQGYFGPGQAPVMIGSVPPLDTLGGTVAEFMSPQIVAVGVNATVAQAAQLMKRGNVHRVLVVDDNGNLAGVVSAIDIVHHIAPAEVTA